MSLLYIYTHPFSSIYILKWSFWSASYGRYTPFFCKTIWKKIQIYTSCCRETGGTYHLGATIRTINGDNHRIHKKVPDPWGYSEIIPSHLYNPFYGETIFLTCGFFNVTSLFFSGEVKVTILDVLGPGYIITFMFVAMDVATTPGDMLAPLGWCTRNGAVCGGRFCGGFYVFLMEFLWIIHIS